MKKRIGWLNNKPIIQGDKNLKNSNELHIDELSSNNNDGGGGDLSNIPCYYYKIIKTPDNEEQFNMFFANVGYFEYIVDAEANGIFQTNVTSTYGDYTDIIACKLIDIPVITSAIHKSKILTIIMSGDIINRFFITLSKINADITIDMIQQQLDILAIQITKEEYESLITIKPIE